MNLKTKLALLFSFLLLLALVINISTTLNVLVEFRDNPRFLTDAQIADSTSAPIRQEFNFDIKILHWKIISKSVTMALILLIVFSAAAIGMAAHLRRPIRQLSHQIAAINNIGQPLSLSVPKDKELAELVSHLNRLTGQVFHLHDLKEKFDERTAELNHANEKLARYSNKLEQIVIKRLEELREKDAELIQSEKLTNLGEMATSIAHEINQPINVIKLIVSGLLRIYTKNGTLDHAHVLQELQTVNKQVARLQKIITHMKAFARKRVPADISPIDVNVPISEAFLLIGQQLHNHGIEVDLQLQDKLPLVKADPTHLEQIIINLANNARDSLDEKFERLSPAEKSAFIKKLSIRTEVKESRILIEVADNGSGMAGSVVEKIFEPFYTTKLSKKGTGLGLSICYNLLRGMNGEISVVSEEGQGARFLIRLPAA